MIKLGTDVNVQNCVLIEGKLYKKSFSDVENIKVIRIIGPVKIEVDLRKANLTELSSNLYYKPYDFFGTWLIQAAK